MGTQMNAEEITKELNAIVNDQTKSEAQRKEAGKALAVVDGAIADIRHQRLVQKTQYEVGGGKIASDFMAVYIQSLIFCVLGWIPLFLGGGALYLIFSGIYYITADSGSTAFDDTTIGQILMWPIWIALGRPWSSPDSFISIIFGALLNFAIISSIVAFVLAKRLKRKHDLQETETKHSHASLVQMKAESSATEAYEAYQSWVRHQDQLLADIIECDRAAQENIQRSIDCCWTAIEKLNHAETEHKEGAFVAFWEHIESATHSINVARMCHEATQKNAETYSNKLEEYEASGHPPIFSVSCLVFEKTRAELLETAQRMKNLSYKAQKDYKFATIYEQRRNTSTLVEGFSSLNDAIQHMGDRIVNAVESLEDVFHGGLGQLSASLSAISSNLDELIEVSRQNETSTVDASRRLETLLDDQLNTVNEHARFTKKSAIEALQNDYHSLRMLNNIQLGVNPRKAKVTTLDTILDWR